MKRHSAVKDITIDSDIPTLKKQKTDTIANVRPSTHLSTSPPSSSSPSTPSYGKFSFTPTSFEYTINNSTIKVTTTKPLSRNLGQYTYFIIMSLYSPGIFTDKKKYNRLTVRNLINIIIIIEEHFQESFLYHNTIYQQLYDSLISSPQHLLDMNLLVYLLNFRNPMTYDAIPHIMIMYLPLDDLLKLLHDNKDNNIGKRIFNQIMTRRSKCAHNNCLIKKDYSDNSAITTHLFRTQHPFDKYMISADYTLNSIFMQMTNSYLKEYFHDFPEFTRKQLLEFLVDDYKKLTNCLLYDDTTLSPLVPVSAPCRCYCTECKSISDGDTTPTLSRASTIVIGYHNEKESQSK